MNDLLGQLAKNLSQFRDLTNFSVEEFFELCKRVVPTIESNARSTGRRHVVSGHPSKLTTEQRLLNFVLYMKHNNVIYLDNMLWNWSRSVVCDNAIFVASCINKALADEVKWPFGAERRVLGAHIPQLKGCISCVHGTLVQIRHSYKNEHHTRWYHGRKIMYCMNNTILVDHDGLFIFVDGGYPGSFHDMTILKNSWVEMHW